MKIQINSTAPLLEALALASLALPPRSSLPALTLVKISVTPSLMVLRCDCLDSAMRVEVGEIQADGGGSLFVAPKLLKASLRGESAVLTIKDNKMTVESGGKSVISLAEVHDEFPKDREPITTKEVDGKSLNFALKAALNCIEANNDTIRGMVAWDQELSAMVGADGKSFHIAPIDLGLSRTVMIPRFSAQLMHTAFSWDAPISVGLDNHTLHLVSDNVQAWCQLAEGTFRYAQIIPEAPKLVKVGREELLKVLNDILPFCEPDLNRVIFDSKDGKLTIRATHNGNETTGELDGECEFDVCFHAMLLAVTKAIKYWSCDTLDMHVSDRILMLPGDESGCRAIVGTLRQ